MTRQELLNRLEYFLNPENGIGAALYFVLNENGNNVIRFADIDNDAKEELQERFLEYIGEKFTANEELHYMNISEADDRKNVAYRYDIEERDESLNILNEIIAEGEREYFNFNDESLTNLQGYLITIGNEANQIALFKKHHPVNLLKRDRFLLVPSNQRLVAVNNDVLAIDKSFDFMLVDEELIILKLNTLERFFGFENVVRSRAETTIAAIEAVELLEDIGQLNELAQSMTNARKLMRMRNSPVIGMPVDAVIGFINNHPELTGRIDFNEDGTRIRLTTGVSKKLFLKILNDDYLFSQLTNLQYDSHAKDRLANNTQEGE